ncbi:MAG: hypothetical protein HY327_00830 [Chloroflexi bacterium]|nr:hypothetical protein [Chloroflexota bacterium]
MRRIISLNDDRWRVGRVTQKPFGNVNDLGEAREWLPAQVPGDVRLDLLRAGKISDPFYADNNESSQWVDAFDWWYTREIDLALRDDERAFLVFEGIDYLSAVFVNEQPLGRHAGMFSRQVYEISDFGIRISDFKPPVPNLAIRIWGSDALPKMKLSPLEKIWRQVIRPLISPPNEPYPPRFATLKCQMQFGWDFAPRLRTCGIWDDAFIVITRSVFIEQVQIKSQVQSPTSALINVSLSLDSDIDQQVRVECSVRGKNFLLAHSHKHTLVLNLARGKRVYSFAFELPDPRLWNAWDRGEPNLYELEIHIETLDSGLSDYATIVFGIRSIELVRAAGTRANAEAWTFVVNGKREFLRGANWVPLDAIPARLTRADYAARLQQARDANINFLRVWGGGLREKRAFYDLCDELGILVWQEFPFAGAVLDQFPRTPEFLEFVSAECGAIVRALRNHPALVVWCGGNEFNTRSNRAIVETLRDVVAREDNARPFKPASPYRDESHNWRVWHRMANLRDYKKDRSPFLSEFGLQAAPNVESLQKFLPSDSMYPPNALWKYHHAELKKLYRYARSVDARTGSLDAFVDATQRAQAHALQIAIEHMRRQKGKTAGVALWQLNDPVPNISWSIIDYYGAPKRAYHALVNLYAPLFASFDYALTRRRAGDVVQGELWLVNDTLSPLKLELSAVHNGAVISVWRLSVAADCSTQLDSFAVTLHEGANQLRLILRDGGRIVSENEYDLNFCDVGEINPISNFVVTIANRLMR